MKKTELEKLILQSNKSLIIKTLKSLFSISSKKSIKSHFNELNNIYSINRVDFDFILKFALDYNLIEIVDEKIIIKNDFNYSDDIYDSFTKYYLNNIIINKPLRSKLFGFNDFNIREDSLKVDISKVPIDLRGIYIVFERLGIVETDINNRKLKIIKNFDIASTIYEKSLKKLSKARFDEIQKKKVINGELAELFVLKSETLKLKKSPYKAYKVSDDNVYAGFDITSYDLKGNKMKIEVKKISEGDKFYLSKNEINASKVYKKNYFIYCVRFKDGYPSKIEKIICDPYKHIFKLNKYKHNSKGDYIIYL